MRVAIFTDTFFPEINGVANTLVQLNNYFHNQGIWSRGIDTTKFHPSFRSDSVRHALGGDDKLLFSYVGRLSAEKDLDIYLESIADGIIRLAADTNYRDQLRQGGLDTAATRSWNSIFDKLTHDYTSLIEKAIQIAG